MLLRMLAPAVLLVVTSLLKLFALAKTNLSKKRLLKLVESTEKFDSLILKNDKISLSFMKDNGSLFSIKNIIKGTDYIDGSVGGNWAMMVDISTDDPFLSNPTGSNTYLVSSRKQTMSYLKDDVEDGIKLTFTYDISDTKVNNIKVIQTITLLDKDDKASFSYHIQNSYYNPHKM